jgi:hypothetical protein
MIIPTVCVLFEGKFDFEGVTETIMWGPMVRVFVALAYTGPIEKERPKPLTRF